MKSRVVDDADPLFDDEPPGRICRTNREKASLPRRGCRDVEMNIGGLLRSPPPSGYKAQERTVELVNSTANLFPPPNLDLPAKILEMPPKCQAAARQEFGLNHLSMKAWWSFAVRTATPRHHIASAIGQWSISMTAFSSILEPCSKVKAVRRRPWSCSGEWWGKDHILSLCGRGTLGISRTATSSS